MKHAGAITLKRLTPLLEHLRKRGMLKEKTSGVFYWRSRAFLHFHEDAAGLFADARLGGEDFTRFPVSTDAEREALLRAIEAFLAQEKR